MLQLWSSSTLTRIEFIDFGREFMILGASSVNKLPRGIHVLAAYDYVIYSNNSLGYNDHQ